MKKLFILSFAVLTVFASCNQTGTTADASQQNLPTAAEDSLAGTFTSKDAKSIKLLSIIRLFSKQDTSYLSDYAPNFTLSLHSDTAVVARGPEGFAAYHRNLHSLFTDIYFSDGNKFTYNFGTQFKTMQINDDSLKVVVVGNFDITSKTSIVNFPADGIWYSYLTGTNISINGGNSNITLQPGEYHIYLNKDLSTNLVTAITRTPSQSLNANIKVFPNPMHSTSTISYNLLNSGKTEIELFDLNGVKQFSIFKGFQLAGSQKLYLNTKNFSDKKVKTGVYLLMIKNAGKQETKKIIITE